MRARRARSHAWRISGDNVEEQAVVEGLRLLRHRVQLREGVLTPSGSA